MTVIDERASGDASPTQDLIPEVRQRTRRRRLRTGLITLALVATLAVTVSIAGATFGGTGGTRSTISKGRPGEILTSTALGKDTTIGDVQMMNSRYGYAIAFSYARSNSSFYLVSTSNSARTWRFVSPIGGLGAPYTYFSPTVDFVNSQMGYVINNAANSIALTLDGGHTWRSLDIASGASHLSSFSFAMSASRVFVSSSRCTSAIESNSKCPTWLSVFHVGATTPFATRRVPTFAGGVRWMHLLAAINSHDIFVAPQVGGPLEESSNEGVTWRPVPIPCASQPTDTPGRPESPVQLATFANGAWLLDCFTGVGMNHGVNSLWSSSDHGTKWRELSYAGVTTDKGNLMGDATAFVWSNDHHRLYAMWTGAAAGVGYSTNGTAWHWTLQDSANGGSQGFLAPIGPEGMLYSSPSDVLSITTNATNWRTVRAQPDVVALTPNGEMVMSASVARHQHYRIA